MYKWDSDYGQMEAEANVFASFLLMPLDDFRQQIAGEQISMELMQHLSNRYGVSISAAILKWLDITEKRAMIVVGIDGFIDWAWSSKPLIKSGIYYRARQETKPLPPLSLAARNDTTVDNIAGIEHPKGVWLGDEKVHEMTILARQGEMTISLLIYQTMRQTNWNWTKMSKNHSTVLTNSWSSISARMGNPFSHFIAVSLPLASTVLPRHGFETNTQSSVLM